MKTQNNNISYKAESVLGFDSLKCIREEIIGGIMLKTLVI